MSIYGYYYDAAPVASAASEYVCIYIYVETTDTAAKKSTKLPPMLPPVLPDEIEPPSISLSMFVYMYIHIYLYLYL